ncbi:MAG: hypothetical protein RIS64_495 [Bacteroidota bacterium]|jgi:sensor histidine kinase YesM
MSDKKRAIGFNILFWLLYFLYEWLGHGAATDQYALYFESACFNISTSFVVAFVAIHLLGKPYHHRKTTFWISQIALAVIFVLFRRIYHYYIVYPVYFPFALSKPLIFFPKLLIEFVNLYLIVCLYGMFYFVRSWYQQQQTLQNLKQEKIAAELELLKSQVQPHFIFNMLNNIYAGAFKTSPETAQQILKLSNLLEYSLYDSKKERIALIDELNYIQNYLDLQKIRIGEKLDVSFNIFDNINGVSVPPLLLLPIVENCFKHGVHKAINPSWIRFDVAVKKGAFVFKAENSIEDAIPSNENQNSGLGLKNVKRRLELLYPDAHEFKIYKETNSFLIVLKLSV